MADVAGVQDPGQTEGQEPQGGGASPSGQPDGGGSAQPGGESPPAGDGSVPGDGKPAPTAASPEGDKAPEGYVPYPKLREARVRGTQIQQEYEQAKQQWEQEKADLEAKIQETTSATENSQEVQDYRYMQELLRQNPDIYQMLEQRVRESGNGYSPVAPNRNGAPAGRVEMPPEMKKWGETLERMEGRLTAQEQAAQQRESQARNAQVEQQLTGIVGDFLKKKNYGNELAPMAMNYILDKAERDPKWQGMDFEDVPHVLNEWYGMMERAVDARTKPLLNGKQEDSRLPPSPGGNQAPVRGAPAVDDNATRGAMLDGLRRMGWGGH